METYFLDTFSREERCLVRAAGVGVCVHSSMNNMYILQITYYNSSIMRGKLL